MIIRGNPIKYIEFKNKQQGCQSIMAFICIKRSDVIVLLLCEVKKGKIFISQRATTNRLKANVY